MAEKNETALMKSIARASSSSLLHSKLFVMGMLSWEVSGVAVVAPRELVPAV